MIPQFRLTEPAIRDIEQIADYIAKVAGLVQSERFLSKLEAKFAKIAQFPNLGRRRDEVLPGLRSFTIDNYLISNRRRKISYSLFIISTIRDRSACYGCLRN